MNQSPAIGALTAALAKARAAFKPVIKDANNPFFKSKYADLAGVLDAVVPALSANGLAVIQTTDGTAPMVLTTTIAHSSGEFISGTYPIVPVKNDPQGVGSAITYARRYTLCAILSVAAEDDDGNAATHAVKAASVTGEVVKRKPEWLKEQTDEAGVIIADIYRIGKASGEKEVADIRSRMKYDQPADVLEALSVLLRKWQDIEAQSLSQG